MTFLLHGCSFSKFIYITSTATSIIHSDGRSFNNSTFMTMSSLSNSAYLLLVICVNESVALGYVNHALQADFLALLACKRGSSITSCDCIKQKKDVYL